MPAKSTRPRFIRNVSELWPLCFGSATGRQVLLRMAVDFALANVVLVVAVTIRLLLMGEISLENPLGAFIRRINGFYLMNVGWFTTSALLLFAASGLYKPIPSAWMGKRLFAVARACALGLALHAIPGSLLLGRGAATIKFAVPAWCLLWLVVGVSRASRMQLARKFRLVPRSADPQKKLEDILVVGGAGYIGSVLARQLLEAGYRVRVLDLELFGVESLEGVLSHPRLEMMKGDFRNVEDVVRALNGMDAVVHLAAIVGDPACALDEETTIAVNYAAAKMMAQLARANGVSRFVFASTCSVYGESDELRDEDSDLNPVSLYATTKIDAERALLEAADDVFQPTILRFATAYGWSFRPRFDLVANLLSAQAVTEQHIRIFNGDQWRPFVHTRDIARACVMTLQAPLKKVGGQIFNVGDDSQNYTLSQLGQIVARSAPGTRVEEITNSDDPRNYRVNFDRIRNVLGFRASVTLEEGIQEIVDAVRSGGVADWTDPIYSNSRHLQGAGLTVLKFTNRDDNVDEMVATRQFLAKVGILKFQPPQPAPQETAETPAAAADLRKAG
jgi:nucleoside-diphosphate-sugar epimerase